MAFCGGIDTKLWRNGPIPGAFYNFPGGKTEVYEDPAKYTLSPMVTGSSVLGMKFNGGVLIAADMLGSYGSLARFRNISRLTTVGNNTALGAAGDYADFQYLKERLEQNIIYNECLNDGHSDTPASVFSWLTRVMYYRRSQFNPLWNTVVVGGVHNGESFLGYVDKIGTAYESDTAACGFGAYIALPMMRDAFEKNPNMSEAEAKAVLERCLRVLFYRDARSFNKYEIAVVTAEGARIEQPASASTNWEIADMVEGYE
ncbi:proteasome subunit beta type-4-like [Anneissia japonica]|uniref:proteasome subunit beta type-4-like n=1 Tax=Anneissia japonica TaxID=1529436 RepID=UPI0014255D3F|nr:proteasome subunit beta type-4-like [Anneissia japonica]